jgi:hypothetical protein
MDPAAVATIFVEGLAVRNSVVEMDTTVLLVFWFHPVVLPSKVLPFTGSRFALV